VRARTGEMKGFRLTFDIDQVVHKMDPTSRYPRRSACARRSMTVMPRRSTAAALQRHSW
jgi:hypothetical protein